MGARTHLSNSVDPVSVLPIEVFSEIIEQVKYENPVDLYKLRRVSKRWKYLLDILLNKRFRFKVKNMDGNQLLKFQKLGNAHLKLSFCPLESGRRLHLKQSDILDTMEQLESVVIENVFSSGSICEWTNLSKMQDLTLINVTFCPSDHVPKIRSPLKTLKIVVNNFRLLTFSWIPCFHFDALETLIMNLGHSSFKSFQLSNPGVLKRFEIESGFNTRSEIMEFGKLLSTLKSLEILSITHVIQDYGHQSTFSLYPDISKLTNLKQLTVNGVQIPISRLKTHRAN